MATHSRSLARSIPQTEERAAVHRVAKSRTRLSDSHTQGASDCEGIVTVSVPEKGRHCPLNQDTEKKKKKQRDMALYMVKLNFEC